ncbi:MAG: hypothetical protein AB3N64_13610 [Puniceicoccaceae bacterium]
MKQTILTSLLLLLASSLFATGPWSEYAETPPPDGSPAALAGAYVRDIQTGDLSTCSRYMVPEYLAWLESLGGLESALDVFINADLEKRFAWRQLVEGDVARVWVRVFVVTRGREVNVALNLINTSSGWKLTK